MEENGLPNNDQNYESSSQSNEEILAIIQEGRKAAANGAKYGGHLLGSMDLDELDDADIDDIETSGDFVCALWVQVRTGIFQYARVYPIHKIIIEFSVCLIYTAFAFCSCRQAKCYFPKAVGDKAFLSCDILGNQTVSLESDVYFTLLRSLLSRSV